MLPLPHRAFALQNGQNHGYAYLPRCRTRLPSLLQNADALPRTGHHRSARFRPEAPLLSENKKTRHR
jgi:hypothetical protein